MLSSPEEDTERPGRPEMSTLASDRSCPLKLPPQPAGFSFVFCIRVPEFLPPHSLPTYISWGVDFCAATRVLVSTFSSFSWLPISPPSCKVLAPNQFSPCCTKSPPLSRSLCEHELKHHKLDKVGLTTRELLLSWKMSPSAKPPTPTKAAVKAQRNPTKQVP